MAGHSGQFTPDGYLSTVIHTTLVGLEPTTFRLLVRRATSSATATDSPGRESAKQTPVTVEKWKSHPLSP